MKRIIFTENQMKMVLSNIINEQVGFERQDNVNTIVSTKDPRHSKFLVNKDLGYMVKRAGLMWNANTKSIMPDKKMDNEFNQNISKMKSMMDETSIQVFDSMLTKNPIFYYYCVWLFINGQFGTQTKNKKIVVDNQTTIKQEMVSPGKEGKEIEIPNVEQGYEMITPPSVEQPMQFQFNEAVMTPQFIQYINETIFGGIDQAISNMTTQLEKDGRKAVDVYINKLQITSSSSTIPNGQSKQTFPGKVPTFKELSDARAKVVYDYLVSGLSKRNAKFNQEGIVINSNGTNAGKMITIKNGNKMIEVDGTGTSGDAYVGQNKQELIKNQRVDMSFSFAVRGTNPPKTGKVTIDPIPPQFAPVEVTDFMIRFTATGRNILKLRPNLNIRITLPKISFGGLFGRGTSMPCPKF
jgi:hypothetical protein